MYTGVLGSIRDELHNRLLDLQNKIRALEESNRPEVVEARNNGASTGEGDTVPTGGITIGNVQVQGDFAMGVAGDQASQQLSTGDHANQEAITVRSGDIEPLLAFLREQEGIEEDDLQELEQAVASEADAPSGAIGPGVKDCWSRISGKLKEATRVVATKMLEGLLDVSLTI